MNRKISVGMAVTIVILAMTVTFSITMLIAMRLFDSTVSSVKEKESMYNKVAEVDRPLLHRQRLHRADEPAERQGDGHWRGTWHGPDRLCQSDQGV